MDSHLFSWDGDENVCILILRTRSAQQQQRDATATTILFYYVSSKRVGGTPAEYRGTTSVNPRVEYSACLHAHKVLLVRACNSDDMLTAH